LLWGQGNQGVIDKLGKTTKMSKYGRRRVKKYMANKEKVSIC